MMHKTIRLSILAIVTIALFSCGEDKPDNPEPPAQDAKISIAAIGGVTVPVAGATPVTAITATDQFTGAVTWSPAHAAFAYGTAYTATITLTPKTGYTLAGVAENFFTVAGATSASNAAGSGAITAAFPKTEDVADAKISIAAIGGVTVPVAGATPVASITATDQFTGTVTWEPAAATFAYGTAYTATITLTPKTGYTLAGVAANFFTVAGATSASNAAGSGAITAAFPKTEDAADAKISIAAIDGLTVPAAGATPVTAITANDQFTGTVAWEPAVATFAYSTVYTATVTLTPKAGYTLAGVAADFFTVAGATSASNPANSGVITVVFPKTDDIGAPATFTGVEVLNMTWAPPAVSKVNVGPAVWDVGSTLTATYTGGSANLRLKFSNGSTKDTTINNLSASIVVKFEKLWAKSLISGRIYVDSPMETSPVQGVIVDKATTATAYTETVRFSFAKDELYVEHSIANGLISVPIRGQQVPIPFGNGTLEMTRVARTFVDIAYKDDKLYNVYSNGYVLAFRHPAATLVEEIQQAIQVAEPRP